ncbi:NeuD/PglB/VioB family sugar acetyltransferase [Nocardioides gilvus]|uniref:NeuD/PglB/VioB family sugar acetyltransferase n=1 Tax=Nocardioides gilvus TaxID=1735589 RepID=UPI000D749D97|nr:NeuD/PglB/VioB family sugar acetyltransferase [Nocardioides gilvus]
MAELLVVIGAGGFGRETADVVEAINRSAPQPQWLLQGVVDDSPSATNLARLTARGIAHLGSVDDLIAGDERPQYVVGIGSPRIRRILADKLDAAGFNAATLVHPDASVGSQCTLGEGTIILAGARVTTNVHLGRHVHLNPNVTVGHDTVLEDFVSMNPASSVSGDCLVQTGALIGVGAVVLNQLTLGPRALVGGSACVVTNVAAEAVVKGVPAR